jgi:Tol biopolymer transport system component
MIEAIGQPQEMAQPSLSPDGQRVAVRSNESGNYDIWVHDLTRSSKTQLTFEDQTEANPAWSPSGREIVYRLGGSPNRIMRRAADGTGEAVALVEAEVQLNMPEWSRDGRYLAYREDGTETRSDIRYVELGAGAAAGEPVTFLDSPASESSPKLSPDGRFLAYMSDQSGRSEIYVRPFPSGDGEWQASVNGGNRPRWRSDGKELYYVEGDTLMAVSVSTGSAFTPGQPQPLFEAPGLTRGYDVSADGQRFITVAPAEADGEEEAPPAIRIVQNCFEEFRDREQ